VRRYFSENFLVTQAEFDEATASADSDLLEFAAHPSLSSPAQAGDPVITKGSGGYWMPRFRGHDNDGCGDGAYDFM
jgi:hypothetical protein